MTRWLRWFSLGVFLLGSLLVGCSGDSSTSPSASDSAPEGSAAPKAEFPKGTEQNAGNVDYAQPKDFTFPVHNGGSAPLKLTLERRSCSCADIHMPKDAIAPNATENVTIHWAPIPGNSSGEYHLTAGLGTNDPAKAKVELSIHARITPLVYILIQDKEENSYLDFGNDPISPRVGRVREVKLVSTELSRFEVTPSIPLKGFEVEKKPLSRGSRLGGYEVQSGYTIEVRATGALAPGDAHTVLDLRLSQLGSQPDRTVSVPVYAVMGGSGVTVSPEVIRFKSPRITDGIDARVHLTFRSVGTQESVAVVSCDPPFVKVDPPTKEPDGKWLLTAHIPKDNAEAARYQPDAFMEGRVVLKVSGEDRPLTIRLTWSPD